MARLGAKEACGGSRVRVLVGGKEREQASVGEMLGR